MMRLDNGNAGRWRWTLGKDAGNGLWEWMLRIQDDDDGARNARQRALGIQDDDDGAGNDDGRWGRVDRW